MADTYACNFFNCDKIFSKAYELKKHKATHEDPDSVFYCSKCDFITLQKKSLVIHSAIHTGEKAHSCPDYIVGPSIPPQRCEFRTNDPAALSKHRKKVHGYVPQPNRSRPKVDTATRKLREKKDETVTRRCRRPQRSASQSRRRQSHVSRVINHPNSALDYTSTSADNISTLLGQGNTEGDAIDVNHYDAPGYDLSNVTSADFDEGMHLDMLYDPSLRSQWMVEYEEGYSTFDATRMKYLPEHLHLVSSSASVGFVMQTGREGCLCPEWMVEAGVEGWDQSVVGDAPLA